MYDITLCVIITQISAEQRSLEVLNSTGLDEVSEVQNAQRQLQELQNHLRAKSKTGQNQGAKVS